MKKTLSNFMFLILISLSFPIHARAGEIKINSDDQLEFARHYMDKDEYQKAIVELERMIYFFPEDKNVTKAFFLKGVCHLETKEYNSAREIFMDVYNKNSDPAMAEKALFLIGESYYRQGLLDEAEHYFKKAIDDYPGSELKDMALYRLGWTDLKAEKWNDASETFNLMDKESPLYASSSDIAEKLLEGENLKYKNPGTAGILAGIIPGMGHVYCDRYRDGAIAFLLNTAFIWAAVESFDTDHDALGGILSFLEIGWYTGNIYSAVNCAHKNNRKVKNDFINSLPGNLNLNILTSDKGHLGITFGIDF